MLTTLTQEDAAIFSHNSFPSTAELRGHYRRADRSDSFDMTLLAEHKNRSRKNYLINRDIGAASVIKYEELINLKRASESLIRDFSR